MKSARPIARELILASTSPRRRELLENAGFAFHVLPPRAEERPQPGEAPADYAQRNAREKARSVIPALPRDARGRSQACAVIGADTIVVLDGRILEKPRDDAHARAMLKALAGREHEVITGVCAILTDGGGAAPRERCFATRTAVVMRRVSDEEIEAYLATGEPADKAGAYAVQGRAAGMIRELRGSYTNVVGLPLAELIEILAG